MVQNIDLKDFVIIDNVYSVINDGEKAVVWHPGDKKEISPIIVKNSLEICMILPFCYDEKKGGVTVINAVPEN